MNEFFTWTILATYAGALAATMGITQLLKGVGFIDKLPTRVFSWIVALIVLVAAELFLGSFTAESGVLCAINAVVVSLAANGGYDLVTQKKG